jgi:hypothetical protein
LCPLAFVFALMFSGNGAKVTETKANRSHVNLDGNALALPAESSVRQPGTASYPPGNQSLSRE